MSMSGRAREKRMVAAAALQPDGTEVRGYAHGRGHARITTGAVIAFVVLLMMAFVGLAFGYLIVGGAIPAGLAVYLYNQLRPPRGVVPTDQALAVVATSFWSGQPSEVLGLLPPSALSGAPDSGSVTLCIPGERITVARGEVAQLTMHRAPPSDGLGKSVA